MTPALAAALVKAQADMPALQRDKLNPHFKSRYLSLESLLGEVLPVLNGNGLALVQLPTASFSPDGAALPSLRTILVHGESGESIETTMLLLASKSDPQGQGSAITYARRYSLMSMLGLSADEDDDGNAATGRARGSRQSPKGQTISETERKRLFPLAKEAGITTDRLKELVREHAGVESTNDIPKAKYDALLAAVKAEKVAA